MKTRTVDLPTPTPAPLLPARGNRRSSMRRSSMRWSDARRSEIERASRNSAARPSSMRRRSVMSGAAAEKANNKRCRWLRRNWIFLSLLVLAGTGVALAAMLFLEPCPLSEVTTRTTNLAPVDVVFLLDSSGSMNGQPWEDQKEATSTLLRTLVSSSNHSFANGTFKASIVQWSGESRESPGAGATHVDQALNNNVTDTLVKLGELDHKLKGWTHFSPGLTECANQLNTYGQEGSYKLCVLVSDGVNFDGDDYVYSSTDGSSVDEYCQANNLITSTLATDLCTADVDSACKQCVETADSFCAGNVWDDTCRSQCTSTCSEACPTPIAVNPSDISSACTTTNIARGLRQDDVNVAGILVLGEGAAGDQAEANVKGLTNCANATARGNASCPYYFRSNDFSALQDAAENIASSLASEILSTTSEKTAFVCLGSPEYLNFLLLILPLLAYLAYKPLQFCFRRAIHENRRRRLSVMKDEVMKMPPPPPPSVLEEVIEEDEEEEQVEEQEEVVVQERQDVAPIVKEGTEKRFKWDIPSSDKYIWTSSKGVGHMPVNFATSNNASAPPSAPKDPFGAKGEKTLRLAKKWEDADFVEYEREVQERQAQIEEKEEILEEEEEKLEVRVENVYNGDDLAEVIADGVVDSVEFLFCRCCGFCGCCCCSSQKKGEEGEDGEVEEGEGEDAADLEMGGGGDDDEDIVWSEYYSPDHEAYYYFNSDTGDTSWTKPARCLPYAE